MNSVSAPAPWYREPWPWLLMSGPAIVVVAAFVTAFLAWHGADGVVADDYYKRGLAVNDQIGRSDRAASLGLKGRLAWDGVADGDAVHVWLADAAGAATEPLVRVRLVHPGRAELDRAAILSRRPGERDGQAEYVGTWRATAPLAASSRAAWAAVVEGVSWRLDAETAPPVEPGVRRLLPPAGPGAVVLAPPSAAR